MDVAGLDTSSYIQQLHPASGDACRHGLRLACTGSPCRATVLPGRVIDRRAGAMVPAMIVLVSPIAGRAPCSAIYCDIK
jgi:hypothetical protein